ncbi:MAG: hypothetical protein E7262_05060 [Lachnospiraceae bacterium]|nr:hypothetical protein [Lachnospiraceae bacterium]
MKQKVKKILGDLKEYREGADVNFIQALASNYRDYSSTVLAFEYYMMCDNAIDNNEYEKEEISTLLEKLTSLLGTYIVDEDDVTRETIGEIDELRQGIINKVDTLLKYTAKFYMYEYILNRLEYNFNKPIENSNIAFDDEAFVGRIVEYIFSGEDNMIINARIKDVIGQLPIRMTKAKFFDLLKESFSIFNGSTSDGFDSYMDRIKTAATLLNVDNGVDIEYLKTELEAFDNVDYLSIDNDQFDKLQERYRRVSHYISTYTDFYTNYARIINMLYTIVLTKKNIKEDMSDVEVYNNVKAIITHVTDCYRAGANQEAYEEVTDKLILLEGVQENTHHICSSLEQGIDEQLLDRYEQDNEMITDIKADFAKCSVLISASLFVDLQEKDTVVVDDVFINNNVEKLIEELKDLFKKSQKIYTRAVMANILSELPVFFTGIDEVAEYIKNQLVSCKNNGEKMACYAVLSDMMDYDNYDSYYDEEE